MPSASTITAIRRLDTGQSRKATPRGLTTETLAGSLARRPALLALATLWVPTLDVLAGHAL
jgi:hypothetical protein